MNLPTWSDCDAAEMGMDPLQQFIYDHEPGSPHDVAWREQLSAAIDFLLMPRAKKTGGSGAPAATKKSAAARNTEDLLAGKVGAIAITGPVTAIGGKVWKGTNRFYMDGDERKELGSWTNPAGDIEAARLTKETGTMHLVDPRTGDVISMGGDIIADKASTAEMAIATGSPETIAGAVTTEGFMPAAKS